MLCVPSHVTVSSFKNTKDNKLLVRISSRVPSLSLQIVGIRGVVLKINTEMQLFVEFLNGNQ